VRVSSSTTRNASVSESTSSGKSSQDLNEKLATLERLMDDKMGATLKRTLSVNSRAAALTSSRAEAGISSPVDEAPSPDGLDIEIQINDVPSFEFKPLSTALPPAPSLHGKTASALHAPQAPPQKKNFRERAMSQPFPKISSRRRCFSLSLIVLSFFIQLFFFFFSSFLHIFLLISSSGGNSKSNSFPVFFENLLSMGVIAVQLVSDSKASPFLKKRLFQVVHE